MNVAGLIVAGGTARRMGGDKAFMSFAGGFLIDAVIARVRSQCAMLALNVPPGRAAFCNSRYAEDYPLLEDAFGGEAGPLGGVVSGLRWLSSPSRPDWLATFPCDTPFLPQDLVSSLCTLAIRADVPVFAVSEDQAHYLCALWPSCILMELENGISRGELRSVRHALQSFGAVPCEIQNSADSFFNVNTPEDLMEAEERAGNRTSGG